jgi:DNA-binding transcriptional ArsR family regulator
VQGNQVGFESSFQQHLDTEQRRAVLEAIGASINPDSTLGEILDAAETLGWSEKMGDLSLADLAEALLAPEGDTAAAAGLAATGDEAEAAASDSDEEEEEEDDEEDLDEEDLDEDDDEDLDDEDEDDLDEDDDEQLELEVAEPVAARRKAGKTKVVAKAAKKTAAKKGPAKKVSAAAAKRAASERQAKAAPRGSAKKAAKATSKKVAKKAAAVEKAPPPASKKSGKRKLTAVDVDDRMSLDQAAEFFLPYIEGLGEATMQALEEQTGVSRRKLRFHVGQLVKHGYLDRHGMGRGTYYTKL